MFLARLRFHNTKILISLCFFKLTQQLVFIQKINGVQSEISVLVLIHNKHEMINESMYVKKNKRFTIINFNNTL